MYPFCVSKDFVGWVDYCYTTTRRFIADCMTAYGGGSVELVVMLCWGQNLNCLIDSMRLSLC